MLRILARVTEQPTLNYGVRYDLFNYVQPPVKNPDPGLAGLALTPPNPARQEQLRHRASVLPTS